MKSIKEQIKDAAKINHSRDETFPDDHIRETFIEGAEYGYRLCLQKVKEYCRRWNLYSTLTDVINHIEKQLEGDK